jgi:hypothetical protein
MKKKVIDFIRSLGGTANYAGYTEVYEVNKAETTKSKRLVLVERNVRTLFINDPLKDIAEVGGVESIEAAVLNKFGYSLPFTLKTN